MMPWCLSCHEYDIYGRNSCIASLTLKACLSNAAKHVGVVAMIFNPCRKIVTEEVIISTYLKPLGKIVTSTILDFLCHYHVLLLFL